MSVVLYRDGQNIGPYTLEELREGLITGGIVRSDLAWAEERGEWIPVEQVAGVKGVAGAFESPASAPFARPDHTGGFATASLVLGILSLGGLALTGIPALICGWIAHKRLRTSPRLSGGRKTALAGMLLGALGLAATPVVITYLRTIPFVSKPAAVQSCDRARQLYLACAAYANDHGGKYPAAFADLLPDYLSDRVHLQDPGTPGEPVGYLFFASDSLRSGQIGRIILASKQIYGGKRAVVRGDGVVELSSASLPFAELSSPSPPSPSD